MRDVIFVPRIIKVGYQERKDTYSGKLAYVIYYDNKKVLRKERSWSGWRHDSINPDDFTNEPTEGFVLNKKAGGDSWGWNPRQTYARVYDPRGFEFEITIPNLMYVLENASCTKGKGLEGEFVYGWSGTELLLIPVDAPDYKEMKAYSDSLFDNKTFKGKDLILGATYRTKQNNDCIYLGRFQYFNDGREHAGKKKVMRYFFKTIGDKYEHYEIITTLRGKIISLVDEECVNNYADLMEKLEYQCIYSPRDYSKYVFERMTDEQVKSARYYTEAWLLCHEQYMPVYIGNGHNQLRLRSHRGLRYSQVSHYQEELARISRMFQKVGASYYNSLDLLALHQQYPLHSAVRYLKNGNKEGGI